VTLPMPTGSASRENKTRTEDFTTIVTAAVLATAAGGAGYYLWRKKKEKERREERKHPRSWRTWRATERP